MGVKAQIATGRTFAYKFVTVLVVLGLVQSLLSSLAAGLSWPWAFRQGLNIAAFAVDLFLVIEFFLLLIRAARRGELRTYFSSQLGWIDALASVPLLVVVSGQILLAQLSGVSLIGAEQSAPSALRDSRILDLGQALYLLRFLKFVRVVLLDGYDARLSGKRKSAAGLPVALVGAALLLSVVRVLAGVQGTDALLAAQVDAVAEAFGDLRALPDDGEAARRFPFLLVVRTAGQTVFMLDDLPRLQARFGPDDYLYVRRSSVEIYYSIAEQRSQQALVYLQIHLLVLLVVLAGTAAAARKAGAEAQADSVARR